MPQSLALSFRWKDADIYTFTIKAMFRMQMQENNVAKQRSIGIELPRPQSDMNKIKKKIGFAYMTCYYSGRIHTGPVPSFY